MKKAWDDIKSFVTVMMTIAYIALTFLDKMTPEFQNIYIVIVAFYFGTQAEKLANKIKEGSNENGRDKSDDTN